MCVFWGYFFFAKVYIEMSQARNHTIVNANIDDVRKIKNARFVQKGSKHKSIRQDLHGAKIFVAVIQENDK